MNFDQMLGRWEQSWLHGPDRMIVRKNVIDEDLDPFDIRWEIDGDSIDREMERKIQFWMNRRESVFEEE